MHAMETNERDGTYGGVSAQRRKALRRIWKTATAAEFSRALVDEMIELGRKTGVKQPRRLIPAHSCGRCGALVPEGRWPLDGNGPDALCGSASTYNKGCRCLGCVEAKARYRRASAADDAQTSLF